MDPDDPAECRDAPVEHNADGFSADDWNRRLEVLRQTQSYARRHPKVLELSEPSPPPGRRRAAWATTSDLAGS